MFMKSQAGFPILRNMVCVVRCSGLQLVSPQTLQKALPEQGIENFSISFLLHVDHYVNLRHSL